MRSPIRLPVRRIAVLAVAVLTGLLLTPTLARTQTFPSLPFASPGPGAAALDTLYASAPIVIDGNTLFRVAVPVSAHGVQPVAVRANNVSVAIDQILVTGDAGETAFDPHTLHVEIVRVGGQVVLQAIDARHHAGLPIVTVTSADADYQQMSGDVVATQWQTTLQAAIVRALQIRQPAMQRENLGIVARLFATLVAVTIAGYTLTSLITRRIANASAEAGQHGQALDAETARPVESDDGEANEAHRRRLVELVVRRIDPAKRRTFYLALRAIVISLLLLAWFGAIAWTTLQFPATASFGNALARNAFAVAAIWLGVVIADRVFAIVIGRLPMLWEFQAFGTPEDRERQVLRAPTIARALGGFTTFVLAFIGLLATMTQIGIPVGSVVTIGGLAAIAVSLAAQNLIRDVVSGFLVLIEDQFVVGDFVTINGQRGTVERLTLRMVQIRDATGSVVTISHSSATSVVNHSRNWSRVDFEVPVDAAADLTAALALIRKQIADVEADPAWQATIVEPVEWIGIERISRDGIVARARIKTVPMRQYALRRELNERVARAFDEAKITFGAPPPDEAS